MTTNKNIFLLVTAGDCFHCNGFKKNVWPNLKSKLDKRNDIQIIHIELPLLSSTISKTEYHRDLSKFIKWYPTIMLFPSSLWNNFNSKLEGEVMNGKFVKDVIEFDKESKIGYTEISIIDWINKTLSTNSLFKSNFYGSKDKQTIILTNGNNVLGTTYGNNLNMNQIDNKNIIPTYGSYIKFKSSRLK